MLEDQSRVDHAHSPGTSSLDQVVYFFFFVIYFDLGSLKGCRGHVGVLHAKSVSIGASSCSLAHGSLFVCLFACFISVQGLCLALSSGIILGRTWGTLWGSGCKALPCLLYFLSSHLLMLGPDGLAWGPGAVQEKGKLEGREHVVCLLF